jgi:hypothetical protein
LRIKGNYIEKIHELLYKNGKKTLLLESLVTHTYVFPYAVLNHDNNMCVGFVSNINRARSLRKASSSLNAAMTKRISAVFAKSLGSLKYHELVYVSDVAGIYEKDALLIHKLSDSLQMKFLEIITKP